jgi:hypothetical protein
VAISRRQLQITLGLLWLIDAVLQAQHFMWTRGFATQVVAPTGQGQPAFVSEPVHWVSTVIAAHPVAWNIPFVAIQLLLGLGLLVPRTSRAALAASIVWGVGIWYLGEGLYGIASGHASLVTGAPGAGLILAVLAAAAWPARDGSTEAPAPWLPFAWAALWVGGAVFQAVPGQSGVGGSVLIPVLVAAEYLIGIGALVPRTRTLAAALGLALALAFWALGQDFGMLFSGRATDPNAGPLLALMAIAVMPASRLRVEARGQAPWRPVSRSAARTATA